MAMPPPGHISWVARTMLAEVETQRNKLATGVEVVICLCETSLVLLREAAATLQEPMDAAETVFSVVHGVVPSGMDPSILGPASTLLDALWSGPGPLAGALVVAGELVHHTLHLHHPPADGGPLQAALLSLGNLIHGPQAIAGSHFADYASALGLIPTIGSCRLWLFTHVLANTQARMALDWLTFAESECLAADAVLRLNQSDWEESPRERMVAVDLSLRQTIIGVEQALLMLRAMSDALVDMGHIASNLPGLPPLPL